MTPGDEMAPHSRRVATRRDLLRTTLGAAAALAATPFELWAGLARETPRSPGASPSSERPWLAAAERAARWIQRSAITDARGVTWPADPADLTSVQQNLYSGSPGVVLFLLELHHATGDRAWLDQACAGADYLAATMPAGIEGIDSGLYTGIAGVAYALEETARASGRATYAAASRRALELLKRGATPVGARGVAWNESTDVVSGSAGIGLFLLWAHGAMGDVSALDVAARAGHRLIEQGIAEGGGLKWRMTADFARTMPNFAHGTAGVGYFLASLHQATGTRAFLDAAVAGATYLQSIATPTSGDGRVIIHHEPESGDLFYLSWCHGPAGTARLFHRLGEMTGDARWSSWVRQLALGIVASGIPERRTAGFWNNVSRCCGNSGVADFFLSLHEHAGDPAWLAFARRCAVDTQRRATEEAGGLKWTQAEHRVRPELLIAQTGLMQGAAGVGLSLLHLDGVDQRRRRRVVLPDDPWRAGV